jgi:phosphoribosylformylglycinamidine synthase
VFSAPRAELLQTWSETSYQIARLRDDAECAKEEFEALADVANPGLSVALSFDPADDIAAPFIATGARPKIAILREQGVNSQAEMAAAFERAGFAPFDVHMSDLQAGRVHLADFKGLAACGGFSTATCWGQGRAGPSRSCSTLRCASSSRPSSSAPTPLRWAFATAAR